MIVAFTMFQLAKLGRRNKTSGQVRVGDVSLSICGRFMPRGSITGAVLVSCLALAQCLQDLASNASDDLRDVPPAVRMWRWSESSNSWRRNHSGSVICTIAQPTARRR